MTEKKKKIEMFNSLKRLKILCSLNTRLNSLFFLTKQDTLYWTRALVSVDIVSKDRS